METHEYQAHDAVGLAELVAAREVTPAELLAAARRRADEVNGTLNAIVRRTDERADEQLAAEPKPGAPFGGVPFLVKDLSQEQAGIPCSWGCEALKDIPATENATVVDRWLDAGLVIFGRTNTPGVRRQGRHRAARLGPCAQPVGAPITRPAAPRRLGGGGRGGIVPCAGANDGGGSIRIPRLVLRLVGLKPGRGVVPSGPQVAEMLLGSATHGVVSRTVRDSAAMLDVLAGSPPRRPTSPDRSRPVRRQPRRRSRRPAHRPAALDRPHARAAPEARAAAEATAALLENSATTSTCSRLRCATTARSCRTS